MCLAPPWWLSPYWLCQLSGELSESFSFLLLLIFGSGSGSLFPQKGVTKGHSWFQISSFWGAWVAQLVERPTLDQVMISQLVSLSPTWALCWQLRAWSLLQMLCLPLSLPLPCSRALSLSLSVSRINKTLKRMKTQLASFGRSVLTMLQNQLLTQWLTHKTPTPSGQSCRR